MKKRILSVLISGVLLFGTVFANAVSIGFEDLERSDQTSDLEENKTISEETESNIFFEDLEQSDKTSDIEEVLEINETDSYIDEYYFPEATEENIQTLSLDSYNSIMPLSDDKYDNPETVIGFFTAADSSSY